MPKTSGDLSVMSRALEEPTFHERRLLSTAADVGMDVGGKIVKNVGYLAGLAMSASRDPLARGLGTFLRDAVVSKELDRISQSTVKQILANADDPEFMSRIMSGAEVDRPDIPIVGARQAAARQAVRDIRSAYAIKSAPLEHEALKQRVALGTLRLRDYEAMRKEDQQRIRIARDQAGIAERSITLRENEFYFQRALKQYQMTDEYQTAMALKPKAEATQINANIKLMERELREGKLINVTDATGRLNIIRVDPNDDTKAEVVEVKGLEDFIAKPDPNKTPTKMYDTYGRGLLGELDLATGRWSPYSTMTEKPVVVELPNEVTRRSIPGSQASAVANILTKYEDRLTKAIIAKEDKILGGAADGTVLSLGKAQRQMYEQVATMRSIMSRPIGANGEVLTADPGYVISTIGTMLGEEAGKDAWRIYTATVGGAAEGYIYDVINDRYTTALEGGFAPAGPGVSNPVISGHERPGTHTDPLGKVFDDLGGAGGDEQTFNPKDETRQMPGGKARPTSIFSTEEENEETVSDDLAVLERIGEKLTQVDADILYEKIRRYQDMGIKGPQLKALIAEFKKVVNASRAKQGGGGGE
jgi:hypothetical protein